MVKKVTPLLKRYERAALGMISKHGCKANMLAYYTRNCNIFVDIVESREALHRAHDKWDAKKAQG
jgi:hypothetical protein